MKQPHLLLAITGHGFGHATRSGEVLRELRAQAPGIAVTVSTTVPARFFARGEGGPLHHREQAYEPGTIQANCFAVDLEGTRAAYREHAEERKALLERETRFLAEGGLTGVIADVPAAPLRAAHRLRLPSAALWNFTWDWILEPILCGGRTSSRARAGSPRALVEELREDYELAGLHLKLPFSPLATTLPRVEEAPLVGRISHQTREITLARLGLDANDSRPVVLVAMGGWSCGNWKPIRVEGLHGYRLLVVGDIPLETEAPVRRVPFELEPGYHFFDLVRAADVVLSKPGYGIASECIINRVRLLGVERRDFREIPELLRDIRELGPFEELSLEDFFAGRWEGAIQRTLASSTPWKPIPLDGARRVARRLLDHFEL